MIADPIRIPCEGSGCPPAGWALARRVTVASGMCPMCGQVLTVNGTGRIADHDRDDVLAMIDRGDFG